MQAALQVIWLRIPLRVARLWPTAGVAVSDGHYLVRWPVAALLVAPGALLVGLLTGALHEDPTFTYSLVLMIFLAAIGQGGAVFGLAATIGYAFGDFFLNDADVNLGFRPTVLELLIGSWLPALLSYGLLGLLTVVAPVTVLGVRALTVNTSWIPAGVRRVAEPVAAALAAGTAGWVFAHTAPLLIRPVFVWSGGAPVVPAIAPLQERGWWLVFAMAAAAVGRVYLERAALVRVAATFSQVLWAGLGQEIGRGPRRGPVGHVLVGVGALAATLLLSGLYDNVWYGVVVFAFFVALLLVRRWIILYAPAVAQALVRVPFLIRLAVGVGGGYFLSEAVVSAFWNRTQTFLPVLAGSLVSIALITLLTLPPPPTSDDAPVPPRLRERRA